MKQSETILTKWYDLRYNGIDWDKLWPGMTSYDELWPVMTRHDQLCACAVMASYEYQLIVITICEHLLQLLQSLTLL